MANDVRSLASIKTLMGMKHRSMPKAERSVDGELYLLKNNLSLSLRELTSVNKRKGVVEGRIRDIELRIEELERGLGIRRRSPAIGSQDLKTSPKGGLKVMKVEY
jgi:hypothetical protein